MMEQELDINVDQFQNDKFDVNLWMNKTLANFSLDDSSLLAEVRLLSGKLDAEIESTNGEIEKLTQTIIQKMPKVSRDLEVTHSEVSQLQKDIAMGLSDAENVQKKTTASMSALEKLDNVRTKLVTTSIALQEADKWTSLAKQIEQLLESGDVNKSYECILGMEKTLSVLSQGQTEERRLILEEMKNRLEALATKHLILAFDTNNIENAHYFFTMFFNMERTQQFVKYFQSSEKIKLSQEWRKIVEIMSFKEGSVKFYDSLIDHWHAKLQWCKTVFLDEAAVNSTNVLIDLYTDTLRTLDPSLQFCFESETKKLPFIELVLHFNQTVHRFMQNMKQFIEAQQQTAEVEKISFFLRTLFQPFLSQYPKYSKYYESIIVSKIQAANAAILAQVSSGDSLTPLLQDRIENSKRLLPEIILNIKEGEEKVNQFNHGFGYLHFGKGLCRGIEKFVEWNHEIFRHLEKLVDKQEAPKNLLENTLSFAETCGEIIIQLIKLDQMLSSNCGRIFGKMTSSLDNSNPWEDLWGFYLDLSIRTEILQFVQKKETILGQTVNQMKKLCCDATQLVLRVTAEPVDAQLNKNFTVHDSSLKEAIPSEYITQVGEYLMLLPQNLEPFIPTENSSISYAFDQTTEEAGRMPVDFILSNLASSACDAYSQRILKCTHLTEGQAKQLAQDIDYLASVLGDLGLNVTSDLSGISKLLKNYGNLNDISVTERIPGHLVSTIKKMKINVQQ